MNWPIAILYVLCAYCTSSILLNGFISYKMHEMHRLQLQMHKKWLYEQNGELEWAEKRGREQARSAYMQHEQDVQTGVDMM